MVRGVVLQWAHRDEVRVANRPDVQLPQADERLRAPSNGHELDFNALWGMHIDDGTQVSAAQAVLREVAIQHDGA